MTYRQGNIIVASDFNTFRSDVLNIWDVGTGDTGYGQISGSAAAPPNNAAIPSVAVDELIKNAEWEAFRFAAQKCSDHQGSTTTFPPASELLAGEIIEAHDPLDGNAYDINGSLITINTNRLLFDAGSVTLYSNVLNDTRNTAWQVELQHRFTATLPTVDDARYFFNAGGEIRFRGSRSGGSSTPQNTSWTAILSNMGTVSINHDSTFKTGGGSGWTFNAIGYYDLTTSFQEIATGVDPAGGAYASNEARIDARTTDGPTGPNGDRGRVLEFRIRYRDFHTNGFADNVNGTITSDIDYQAGDVELNMPVPVFSTSISLTAGT